MKILYIIPRMTYGGGMPTVLAEVINLRTVIPDFTATVVALETNVITSLMTNAVSNGLKVLLTPSPGLLSKLIAKADLLVIHYWNCPSMFQFFKFLADSQTPHRLCVSSKVNGFTLPQVLPRWVYTSSDLLILSHPRTPVDLLRPSIEARFIPSFISLPDQLTPPPIPDSGTFRMFHAGTLNYFKTHPDLIDLHEGLQINQYQFDIWGSGMDSTFEQDMVRAKSVVYRGFSTDMYTDMAPYHLLCNPQTMLSYGSFDKIMCESQWVGKPVIVLKNSYIADHIRHDINGIVADDVYMYRSLLESLAAQPAVYKQLAERTFEYTRSHYQLARQVTRLADLYQQLIQKSPKQIDPASIPEQPEEAALDGMGAWKQSLLTQPETLSSMEIKYALRCEGGLIHYYKAYPDNTALKGLISQLITLD